MQMRIYQPARTAMQQGRSRADRWLLEHEPESPRDLEPLMGWTSSRDTKHQVRLWFDSKEDAPYGGWANVFSQLERPSGKSQLKARENASG